VTDFARYPYEVLQAVGSSLTTISEQISAKTRSAFEVLGFTPDQSRIDEALGHFRREWEASLNKLGENIGGFGDTSTQIGAMSGQFDAALAASMKPGSASTGSLHGPV
jgi:hypothetical protein